MKSCCKTNWPTQCKNRYTENARQPKKRKRKDSVELAVNDSENEKHENGDDCDGDYPIRSHPVAAVLALWPQRYSRRLVYEGYKPTGHALERLYARVYIAFTLQQSRSGMFDRLALLMEIRKRVSSDVLRLQSDPLAVP